MSMGGKSSELSTKQRIDRHGALPMSNKPKENEPTDCSNSRLGRKLWPAQSHGRDDSKPRAPHASAFEQTNPPFDVTVGPAERWDESESHRSRHRSHHLLRREPGGHFADLGEAELRIQRLRGGVVGVAGEEDVLEQRAGADLQGAAH